MNKVDALYAMLQKVNVTDGQISRGLRLTDNGRAKVARTLKIEDEEVDVLLSALAEKVAQQLDEDEERFTFEKDMMGSITVRDRETGREKFLRGTEASKLASDLAMSKNKQAVLAREFMITESQAAAASEFAGDDKGTFNFPHDGYLVTVGFSGETGKFKLEVISCRTLEGDEVEVSEDEKASLEKEAFKWIDKV